jgi:hypothetical protein
MQAYTTGSLLEKSGANHTTLRAAMKLPTDNRLALIAMKAGSLSLITLASAEYPGASFVKKISGLKLRH